MHKLTLGSVVLLLLTASATTFAAENQKTQTAQIDTSNTQSISLDIPAGKLVVQGVKGNKLEAQVTATCKNDKADDKEACQALLNALSWSKKIGKNTELALMPVKITQYEDITIEVKITVPENKPLNVKLAAGELQINGTSACLIAEVNAGDLSMNLKESQLASAQLNAKVGDVNLTTAAGEKISGERSMLVGAELNWAKGKGTCHLKANLLAGEARLILN
ncbi:MAG: hypothetical protein EOO52_19345 [Gammaproteobacteria bacterium]|nr:MAG: hypothetical protein EOO52_19345 [Gammaproteobacteria bacterium]